MPDFEKDFEDIYLTVIGELAEDLPWVREAAGTEAVYVEAWQAIDDARAHLCQRFGMDWEDPDLERIMDAVMKLQRDVARRMFLCGTACHNRGI